MRITGAARMSGGMRQPHTGQTTVEFPTRAQQYVFEAKASLLRWRRTLRDLSAPPRRQSCGEAMCTAPMLAQFRSPLWPPDEGSAHLVAGKIQNLRLAATALDGIEVPAGQVLSFWKQVGRATRRRGFAIGRELREGCLVPAIGGGLCQISSAIYDTAVRAGLEVVERHRHSRVVPGSLAETDRDATVFWNYLDLRLRAPWPWRLEVSMDARDLHVVVRGVAERGPVAVPLAPAARTALRTGDCSSCGQTECHRHESRQPGLAGRTWLVHDDWPEFQRYRDAERCAGDRLLHVEPGAGISHQLSRLWAKVQRRWWSWHGRPLPQARLAAQQVLARSVSRRLTFDDVHLVIPQSLLSALWMAGDLRGRSFDVLMTALPMRDIQKRLDAAFELHPHSPTLADFRASQQLVNAEDQALAQARRWITPHAEILRRAGSRGVELPWDLPPVNPIAAVRIAGGLRLLLPASALARKGALELREAIRGLPVEVLLPPGAGESPGFWQGLRTAPVASINAGVAAADIVVLPAWVEHQPRGLLRAIAMGKSVIATPACGLPGTMSWQRVTTGDVRGLRHEIAAAAALLTR